MGGRLLDFLGQGALVDRPAAIDVPALIVPNSLAIYFSNDSGTEQLSFWNESDADWFDIALSAFATPSFAALSDVDFTTPPTDGQVFAWDTGSSKLIPADMLTSGDVTTLIAAASIGDLDDVDITTTPPANGDTLVWDTDHFEPGAISGGDVEYLGRVTATAVASLDIPLPAGYDSFDIEFYLKPATDNVTLNGQVTADNFANMLAGATDYQYTQHRASASSAGVSSHGGSGASLIQFVTGQGNDTGEHNAGKISVANAKEAAAPTSLMAWHNYHTTAGVWGINTLHANYKPNTVLNGLRLSYSSGNLTGFAKVWGRKAV